MCEKTSKKGRNNLQRKIPGRKTPLTENNLHMSAGAIAVARTTQAKQKSWPMKSQSRHCSLLLL